MGQSAEELRREIEDTRMSMTRDLDAIGDRVSPRRMAERRWARTRLWFGNARESVFGGAYDMRYGVSDRAQSMSESMGDTAHAVGERVQGMAETVGNAPHMAADRARGNPMVAGGVAFGLGFLASMVFGSTEAEQDAVGRLAEKAQPLTEPLKEQLGEAASQLTDTVKEMGSQAASDLKDDASQRAQEVKGTAQGAAQQTKEQVQSSR